MKQCEKCGGKLAMRVLPEYQHEVIGLPGVVLVDTVEERYCINCGEVASVSFPNLPGMIAAIAVTRAKHRQKLGGRDIRFMREALGWSSRELAEKLGLNAATMSRLENDRQAMGSTSEKLLRVMVCEFLAAKAPAIDADAKEVILMRIEPINPRLQPPRIRLRGVDMKIARRREKAWEEAA
jgi:transcriptional regulator with XRE-family HTH domain